MVTPCKFPDLVDGGVSVEKTLRVIGSHAAPLALPRRSHRPSHRPSPLPGQAGGGIVRNSRTPPEISRNAKPLQLRFRALTPARAHALCVLRSFHGRLDDALIGHSAPISSASIVRSLETGRATTYFGCPLPTPATYHTDRSAGRRARARAAALGLASRHIVWSSSCLANCVCTGANADAVSDE